MADNQTTTQDFGEQDEQQRLASSPWPFDRLPTGIRSWLLSDDAADILSRINDQYESQGLNRKAIGQTVTKIAIGTVKPEQFISELTSKFQVPLALAAVVAQEVKNKILFPIQAPLRAQLGIDIELLGQGGPAGPTAQITKLAKPLVADIRKPEPVAKPQAAPIQPKPIAPTNTANKAEINTQFGFVEVAPTPPPGFKEESLAPPAPQTPAPKPPMQPVQQQTAQPTSTPKAPEQPKQPPHDVVPYKDEHPVVE